MLLEIFHGIADVVSNILAFIHPEKILLAGGLLILVGIVFIETGLFFGFLLPGDSLLFTAGLMTATGVIENHIIVVLYSVSFAAIAGAFIGYWFGRKTGEALKQRPDSFFFKKKHLQSAHAFYDQYGGRAVVIGRFVPIIRTFAPILAGTIRMPFKKFVFFNVSGGLIWTHSMILTGYFLAKAFPQVQHYLEFLILGVGLLAAIPLIKTLRRKKLAAAAGKPATPERPLVKKLTVASERIDKRGTCPTIG